MYTFKFVELLLGQSLKRMSQVFNVLYKISTFLKTVTAISFIFKTIKRLYVNL